jgi:HAE1 family hydrophobic/amphiphilic exporter-1
MTNIGVNEAQIFAHLVDKSKRERTSMQIQDSMRRRLPRIRGARIEFIDLAGILKSGGGVQIPIEVKIFGKDIDKLREISGYLSAKCRSIEGLYDVDTSFRHGKPEIHFKIDREKAAQIGLSVAQIASTIRTSFEGRVATLYRTGGDEFDLRVKYREADKMTLKNVEDILVAAPLGSQHRLSDIAKISKGVGPVRLFRENQKRKASVTANFSGRDLGSIVADIQSKVAKIDLTRGYFVEYGGDIKVIGILLFTGNTLSMPSLLGVIILAGIVVNNGIVLVDYVNQLRARGLSREKAIVEGSITKLRAMLLTALVAIVGMLPMAISSGVGSEMRAPIALSVIGGMVVSTFLMLIVIPTLYSIFGDLGHHTKKRANQVLHGKEG